jgi:hypothetical protein
MAVNPNLAQPLFSIQSITAGLSAGSQSTSDILIAFNQVVAPVLSPPGAIVVNVV